MDQRSRRRRRALCFPQALDAQRQRAVDTIRAESGADALVRGYRPWLDGLRGVAVLLVVVQHTMGQIRFELGSVGVGLFFALSGYLITSLLLDERASAGSVSLSRFYIRRAARLVPALLLVVVVCNALFVLANDYGPLRGSLAALTYTSNYAQVLQHDFVLGYGPTWTLAVEEHFYILWPLALLWLVRRYPLRTALQATLAICLAALLWRAALAAMHVRYSLLGLGSVERADALLYGCAARSRYASDGARTGHSSGSASSGSRP